MLNETELAHVVDLQRRSYSLLKWMADAVTRGFIRFDTAHDYASLPEAASGWIVSHYNDIPMNSRPDRESIQSFSKMFSTYLQNSFEFVRNPGKQLYSPQGHCFCPMCSWLSDAPNLKTKKPSAADKRRARRMKVATIENLLTENHATRTSQEIEAIVDSRELKECVSILTYAHDLLARAKGLGVGPAALVLWRGFAWTQQGSPKKDFELSVESILASEKRVYQAAFQAGGAK